MAADRHLELQPVNYVKSFSETDRDSSFSLVQYDSIMQTWYYITMHLEALHASFLSETNVCLEYTCYFWRPSLIWHQDDRPTTTPPPPPTKNKQA